MLVRPEPGDERQLVAKHRDRPPRSCRADWRTGLRPAGPPGRRRRPPGSGAGRRPSGRPVRPPGRGGIRPPDRGGRPRAAARTCSPAFVSSAVSPWPGGPENLFRFEQPGGLGFLSLPLPRIPEPTRSTRRPLREVRSLSLFNLIHQRDVGLFDRIKLRIPCVGRVPRETLKASLKVRSFKITSPPGKDFVCAMRSSSFESFLKSPAARMRLSELGMMKSPWGASLGSIRLDQSDIALSILLSWGSHVWGWYQENPLN